MAIKVIKHGQKPKWTKTCPHCGCEFEYEAEDLENDYSFSLNTYPSQYRRYIKCPDCGEKLYHDGPYTNWPESYPKVAYTNDTPNLSLENNLYKYDCDKCPNKPDWTKPIVGDTPCTWCPKNQPYCGTVTQGNGNTKITAEINK